LEAFVIADAVALMALAFVIVGFLALVAFAFVLAVIVSGSPVGLRALSLLVFGLLVGHLLWRLL
jgi:hypothetical protein